MKKQWYYKAFDHFLLRTPLFPLEARKDADYLLEEVLEEGMYLASPEFREVMYARGQKEKKVEETLYKYRVRAASRCTPFGLWSGCSIGRIGERTRVVPEKTERLRRLIRPDMDCLMKIVEGIRKDRYLMKQVRYFANDTFYEVDGRYRYIEKVEAEKARFSRVDRSDYLDRVMEKAKSGATLDELATEIVGVDIAFGEAYEFVGEMVETGILKDELGMVATHEKPLECLLELLGKYAGTEGHLQYLQGIRDLLQESDQVAIGKAIPLYQQIKKMLEEKTGIKRDFCQVDLFKPLKEGEVSRQLPGEISRVLPLIHYFIPKNIPLGLQKFGEAFLKRYEEQEIPLLEALDPEVGIGYVPGEEHMGNALLQGIPWGKHSGAPVSPADHQFRRLLLERITSPELREVEIKAGDFEAYTGDITGMPEVFSVLCTLLKATEKEQLIYIRSAAFPNATSLSGRFCHLDPGIREHVSEVADYAASPPGSIVAEVIHSPYGRAGNVICRPHLSEYEICYQAISDLPREKTLPVSDLWVSVRKGQITLRSHALNRVVIPRISSAFDFSSRSTSLFRFLGDLQLQYGRRLKIDSREMFGNMPHIPRLKVENCILTLESWKVREEEWRDWMEWGEDEVKAGVEQWRKKRNIPCEVNVANGTEHLYIDFGNPVAIRVFRNELRKKKQLWIEEFLYAGDYHLVENEEGRFANEFIFSFYKMQEK